MNLIEKTLSTKIVYKNNFLTFEELEVQLPDGNIGSRSVIRHPGAAAVVAITEENKILFVEQYRKTIDKITLEIPAGKIDKGESPEKTVIRELEEETGYIAKEVELLGNIMTAQGFSDEIIYLYKATNLKKGKKQGDADEFINLKEFTFDEVKTMIKNGEINDSKTLSALLYMMI